MKRFLFALSFLLAWIPLAQATDCSATPYTTAGPVTCVVPAGITLITAQVWGAGASGGGSSSTSAPGGGGGGFCQIALTVTPAANFNMTIGAGGLLSSGTGHSGGVSWVNKTTAAQPASSSNGCYANGGTGGDTGTQAGGTGNLGDTNFTGGSGANGNSGTSTGGGGGGGAGNAGNGAGGAGATGGGGGTGGGGNGTNGTTSGNSTTGNQPGGASGGAWNNDGGVGGAGQITLTLTTPSTVNGKFFQVFE